MIVIIYVALYCAKLVTLNNHSQPMLSCLEGRGCLWEEVLVVRVLIDEGRCPTAVARSIVSRGYLRWFN